MITTERLTLRPLTHDDWPFIIDIFSQPDFIRFVADKRIRTQADAIDYLEQGPMRCHQQHGFSMLAMQRRTSKATVNSQTEIIGLCGLLQRDNMPYPDIGYALLPQFYRQGYTLEGAKAVIRYYPDIRPLLAVTSEDNLASQQLLLTLGFKQTQASFVVNAFGDDVTAFQLD